MNQPRDEVGESTVALTDEPGLSNRRFFTRLGAVVLLAAMTYLVWRIVAPLWRPLLWAMLLGALLAPFNLKLTQRLGGRVRLASSITLAIAVLLFLLPVTIVAGAVAAQAAHLLRRLQQQVPDIDRATMFELPSLPWLDEGLAWLQTNAGVSLSQVQGWLLDGSQRLLEALMASGGTMVMGALGTAVSVMLMLFVLFFVLRDGPKLAQDVGGMLPIEEERRARLVQHLGDVTRAVFLGIGLTALAQGVLVGFGFWIAGLPSPLVFGVVAVIAALIPMVGGLPRAVSAGRAGRLSLRLKIRVSMVRLTRIGMRRSSPFGQLHCPDSLRESVRPWPPFSTG
jgi:predicted PurR-regulated permease PerM